MKRDSGGKRDVLDTVLLLRIIVQLHAPSEIQRSLSDLNTDVRTDIADAVALLRLIVGL